MKEKIEYKLTEITSPTVILEQEGQNPLFLKGNLLLQDEGLIITTKQSFHNGIIDELCFATLFPGEEFGL